MMPSLELPHTMLHVVVGINVNAPTWSPRQVVSDNDSGPASVAGDARIIKVLMDIVVLNDRVRIGCSSAVDATLRSFRRVPGIMMNIVILNERVIKNVAEVYP
jgi:hypothetical protein